MAKKTDPLLKYRILTKLPFGLDIIYMTSGFPKVNFYNLKFLGHFYKLLIPFSIKIILLNLNKYVPPVNIQAVSFKVF